MIYLGFDYMVWIVYLFFSGLFGAQVWGILSPKKTPMLKHFPRRYSSKHVKHWGSWESKALMNHRD